MPLFSEAQEGSGVVSDPRALREEETLGKRHAGPEAGRTASPTPHFLTPRPPPPRRPAHLLTQTPTAQRAGAQGICEKGG